MAKFFMWFSFITIMGISFVRCTKNQPMIRIGERSVVVLDRGASTWCLSGPFKSLYSCELSIFYQLYVNFTTEMLYENVSTQSGILNIV